MLSALPLSPGLILTGYATAADEINRQDVVGLMPSTIFGNLYTPEEVDALKDKGEQAGGSHSESLLGGKNKRWNCHIYR